MRKATWRGQGLRGTVSLGLALVLFMGWPSRAPADTLVFFVDAVRENRIDDVRELLQSGADVNAKDMFGGNTGLHWAAHLGLAEMARLLIDNGADPNARNDDNNTPLHWAAGDGHKELVVMLLAHGANVNAVGKGGWTPLRWAEAQSQDDIARILLAAGGRR
jgi:ankyrin repeat protein